MFPKALTMKGMRFCALLLFTAIPCCACSCSDPSVQVKRDRADIIFRGTIVELRNSHWWQPTERTVVFTVSRVWKGPVTATFEMPALVEQAACIGFSSNLLKVGEDLLVYAFRDGAKYYTDICGKHKAAKDAGRDFKELGLGKEPQRP